MHALAGDRSFWQDISDNSTINQALSLYGNGVSITNCLSVRSNAMIMLMFVFTHILILMQLGPRTSSQGGS